MAGVWVPPGKQLFIDPLTMAPLVGGKVYHYIPASSTPKDTWADQAETSLNTNPVILDGNGECTIWGDGLYRQVLTRADDTPVWDQITGFSGGGGGSVTFASPAQVAALAATDLVISPYALGASGVLGGGGGGGYGSHKPISTFGTPDLSGVTVGANDTILTASEGDATALRYYTEYGIIRTNLAANQLTKGYNGDAGFITGPGAGDGAYRPPNFAYMAVKPSTWPVQGDGGFWRGDNRFNDGGEWKIIGPNVRTYDITQRYFEQNTIPHPAWLDTLSGASGEDAFLTSGAAAGAGSFTINGPGTAAWIGKTVAFANTPDGTVLESHVVTNVVGATITISGTLANTYTWNPGAGQVPTIFFGHRSSASLRYTKIRHAGAGDSYIDVARMNINYVPEASQYHPFMAATGGQYGGDVTFNADGVYGQFFESQLQGQTYDVTAYGWVGSFVRNKDDDPHYKQWNGLWMQSGGARPADAGVVILGPWRNGLDTVFATLEETALLNGAVIAGATSLVLNSPCNGAHPNDTLVIGSETKTIATVNAGTKTVTITTGLASGYADKTLVVFPKGGAAANLASGQRIIWNSGLDGNYRGGDPAGVFPVSYGNKQGDLIMESGTDATSDYWSVRFARGASNATPDTARMRMRSSPGGIGSFQWFTNASVGVTGFAFNGGDIGVQNGNINVQAGAIISWGVGVYITWDGVNLKATKNGGGSFVNIV